MKRTTLAVSSLAIVIIIGQAWWIARNQSTPSDMSGAADKMTAAPKSMAKERKPLYWYDPMKPDAHFDKPGKSPFMDMELVPMYADDASAEDEAMKSAAPERKPLYWYDPMKPDAHFDKPGKSPFMDMELVPMYAASESAEIMPASKGDGGIRIDPQIVQNFGVRTAKVGGGGMSQGIHVTGSVEVDERRVIAIESRTAGWVEQLKVRAVGDTIRRGQSIAGVYSPDLYAAQQELSLATRSQDERLVAAARQRLSLQGLSSGQISSVLKDGTAQRRAYISAPQNGVVTELNVREGQQITPGMPLMRVADLSRVWIVIEVPEAESAGLRVGQMAEAHVSALPGQRLNGKVDYVYPNLDVQARTLRARMSFDNPDMMLKPGMYVDVTLAGGQQKNGLSVPSEAVIRTGTRNVVILALGQGRFRPAVVQIGEDRNGWTEIISGLDEGETVVVSGQFLIDSEASLRGTLARMGSEEMTP